MRYSVSSRVWRSVAAVCLAAAGASGCTARVGGDGRDPSAHNDKLRRDNAELRRQIDETQRQIRLLEGELTSHRNRGPGGLDLPEGVAVPVLSGLAFARYTGPQDTDGDGADDTLRLYLRPLDQRGRMLVVAGTVNAQAVELRADAVPRVVADRTFDPAELDAAYRTGLTGDHYSFDVSLPSEALGSAKQLTVKVTLTEAATGSSVTQQAAFPVAR